MSRQIKIETLDSLDVLLNVARKMFDEKGPLLATLKLAEESLTDRQRGVYWLWISVYAEYLGYTKLELHEQYKERVWLNLYLADPKNHPQLCKAVAAMKGIRKDVSPAQYQEIRAYIISQVSHLDATKKNMMDALKQLEDDAYSDNVVLPEPPSAGLVHGTSRFAGKK